MAISAKMVKELRDATGAGMMECKKALTETDGDMDAAVEFLRETGAAKAEKKASRIAAEGVSLVFQKDDKTASIVEVNSETDFVANNEKFRAYVKDVAEQAASSDACDLDSFLAEKWFKDPSKTVSEELVNQIAVIGENLKIRRFKKVTSDDLVVSYVHGNGRIGVVVNAKADLINDGVREALHNVAMQIAALNPKYVRDAEVPGDFIAHETEILKAQIENDPKEAAKPDKVKEGMIRGRINKELKEICLVDQVYVKAEDGKQSVAKYLEQVSKQAGGTVDVVSFVRFETGEGLEKKEEDFAAEVAAAAK